MRYLESRWRRAAAFASALAAAVPIAAAVDSACDADRFICGPRNPEDLVRLPGTDWVLASEMAGPGVGVGGFYLLSVGDRTWRRIGLDDIRAARDASRDAACRGKPTAAGFHGQGLAVDRVDGLRLLAVGHGAREAIEIFRIRTGRGAPELAWTGCVSAPPGAQLNSVAALPGGGLVATKFVDTGNRGWAADVLAGRPTGHVLEWTAQGWRKVGPDLSAPNGIAVSGDGRTIFVAEWGRRRLHRLDRKGGSPPRTIDLGFHPDNLGWGADGSLVVTGQAVDAARFAACAFSAARVCPDDFAVVHVDPERLTVRPVARLSGSPAFGSGTSALDLGREYWVGTWRGDRIARLPKP